MADQSILNTHIAALKSELLSAKSMEEMLGLSSVDLLMDKLLNTPYEEQAAEALNTMQGLPALDEAITAHLQACVAKILGLATPEEQSMIRQFIKGWDVACIKSILRGLHHQLGADDIRQAIGPTSRLDARQVEELTDCADVPTVVEFLVSWSLPWGKILLPLLSDYREDKDLQPLERALDRSRFAMLCDDTPRRSSNENILAEMLGMEAEVANVLMCLRFLGSEEKPGLLPQGPRSLRLIRGLNAAQDLDGAIKVLAESTFRDTLDKAVLWMSETGRLFLFERLMEAELMRQSRRLYVVNPLGIAVTGHYLRCKRNEAANLRLIGRCLGNRMSSNTMRAALLLPSEN